MPAADVIERFIVVHDGHVRVLQEGVHAQDLSCPGPGLFAHLEVEGLRIRKKNDGSALFSDQEAVL